jgi:hypothetical protein
MSRFVLQELGEDWTVEMEWREGAYEGGPAAIWIRPTDPDNPPPGGLSSTALRAINFRDAKTQLVAKLSTDPHGWRGSPDKQAALEAESIERLRHQLANGISAEYLAMLASTYVRRVKSGQPKPVEQIAEDLGKPLQTIRGHLWQARKQGFLTGSAGRKGGDLTVEAMRVLQQMPKPSKSMLPPKSLIHDEPPAGMEEGSRSDR